MTLTPDQYVAAYSSFQDDMEAKVRREVDKVYRDSGLGRRGVDTIVARDLIADALAGLVTAYGPAAESFGMFLFEEMTGGKARSNPTALPDARAAATASTYAVITTYNSPRDPLGSSMSRHVMGFGRGAIHASVSAEKGLAYARVPNYRGQREGKGPCEFCIVLASRGAVYADSLTAGGAGSRYHDECACVPVMMRRAEPAAGDFGDPSDWPKGYNPSRLYHQIYDPSHESSDTIRDVTRKIRASDPTFPDGR